MRRFIEKVMLFASPLLLFVGTSELIIRRIPNDYSYKNAYLRDNAQDIEVLVLGSSHCFYGVNPACFSRRGFNASHLSQSLDYDYFIFSKFKGSLASLDVLVLPVSYFSLFSRLNGGLERWRLRNYSIYYGCRYHLGPRRNLETLERKPLEILELLGQFFRSESNVSVSELGFGLRYSDGPQADLEFTGPIAAKRHTSARRDLVDSSVTLLSKLASECEQMGVKVILFTPPARESYIRNLDPEQLRIMRSTLARVVKSHGNVEYHDFMDDGRFVDSDFKDADHLNGVGAKKLTELIDGLIEAE